MTRFERVSVGFAGGQVLSARVAPAELDSLRKALGGGGRWHVLVCEDGMSPTSVSTRMSPASASAPDPLRDTTGKCAGRSLTAELERLDLGLLRAARGLADQPARDRAVAAFSGLGQHAAIWLALGGAASVLAPTDRRRRWRAATATVAGGYVLNTAIKFAVRRRRPELTDLPPLTRTPTRLSFPSAHATTSPQDTSGRSTTIDAVAERQLKAWNSGLRASNEKAIVRAASLAE